MESEDEDVSENDILDWYKSEVQDIWDAATDSAFSDLSSNLTDMFRQVMNDVKQRSQPGSSSSQGGAEVNGHCSTSNGVHSDESTNTVAVTSDQLMAMLQDDEDWLEEDGEPQEEEMTLSVRLTDKPDTEEDQKNVKGVSREPNHLMADSITMLFKTAIRITSISFKILLLLVILLVILYTSSLLHTPLQKWFIRHVQDYIYPSMRLLRITTLPWVQQYPSLTDWHEETCLIQNPLYHQRDLDCWSCSQIRLVECRTNNLSVSEFEARYYHTGIPLLMKGVGDRVNLNDIKQLYLGSQQQFLQGIGRFTSSPRHFVNISHFLHHSEHLQGQVSWKINRVGTGRLFRRLFKRPAFIPRHTEVALHKYFFVNGRQEARTYKLPMAEFANMWVAQGSGSRTIRFEPSASCSAHCVPLETEIHPGDILFYNWQFWDLQSEPSQDQDQVSVTYVGSFY